MGRKRTAGLTGREAEIMGVLWDLGEASVDDVRQRLAGDPAANTVRTLLTIMAERRLVADDGSRYGKKYRALVDRSEARGSALRRLVDSLFAGSTEEMLVHLVEEGELDVEQIERLRAQVRSARQRKEGTS